MFLNSNAPIKDSNANGALYGGIAGAAAGVGIAYAKAPKKSVLDQKSYDSAVTSRQNRIDQMNAQGISLADQAIDHKHKAYNSYFEDGQASSSKMRRETGQNHIRKFEELGNQATKIAEDVVKLEKNPVQKANYMKMKRSMGGKRAAIGAAAGLIGGSIIGTGLDTMN